MTTARRLLLVLIIATTGCQLATDFDRSRIPDAGVGADAAADAGDAG